MNPRIRTTVALLAVTAAWPVLLAQTATPVKTADSATKAETLEDIIEISPFEVTSSKDTGYVATESLAGTRIRTDLRDIGASISVITKDLMNDIGATDAHTLLQYTPSTEVAGTKSTYAGLGNGVSVDETSTLRAPAGAQRVRGLSAADNTRDFFVTDIPWDGYNVDRIDILRGPNSFLFGLGSPAGIQNASLRSAEFRNKGSVDFRTGSYGSVRSTIDINQVVIDKVLAFRIDGLINNEKFQQSPAYNNDHRIYGALRFDPQLFKDRSFRTSIKLKFEAGDIKGNRPRIVPPSDSITPWFNPKEVTASNPFGGMGKELINNTYDAFRTDGVVAGNGRGTQNSTTINYQPWLSNQVNAQQPYWTIDGLTNQLYAVAGGFINTGARDSNGNLTGVSVGIPGKRQTGDFYGLTNLPGRAQASGAALANAQFGQYKTMSLLDPTIFDFYNNLIDGPTKKEFQKFTTQNIDISQTGWDDRVGINLSYDRQRNRNGGESLLGWGPTLNIDVLKNFPDWYVNAGSGGVNNPNVGRPFVTGAGQSGGSWYFSDRKFTRASIFGELRASDFTNSTFLQKLLGKHRLNGVFASEKYFNENRSYQMYANSKEWAGWWNNNAGNTSPLNDRPPMAFIYLGSSIASRSSASGANIPGITADVKLVDHNVYTFDPTWTNYGVAFNAPWNVPTSMYTNYSGLPNPESTQQLFQCSNPANQIGWNNNFQMNLMRYNDGEDESLLSLAQKSLKQTRSYSGSYQGYLWKDAVVVTYGWRFDEVKTKDVTAQQQPLMRNILNMQPDKYKLPDEFPAAQIVKGHSTSGGMVLHLNKILDKDPLPFNLSLSYNESSNFQVSSVRRDLYGTPIGNPSGNTVEYGIFLSTKDNKYSLRAVKFSTKMDLASSGLSNASGIGGILTNGLNWRNVFLYQLGGYDYPSRGQDSYRNRWTNAYPAMAEAAALTEMNAAITGWNNIQKWLTNKGFFKAWNFTPTGPDSALVDRATYLTNTTQYAPDAATVYSYTAVAPQGFTVTADTESKGYEVELTANPLPNLRLHFNASQVEATRKNVGGSTLNEFIEYMDSMLYENLASGTLTPAGKVPRWGGAANSIGASVYGTWRSNYVLMKLQEGTAAPEIRKLNYRFIANYSFRNGVLKGVGVGAAYRWMDKVIIGYPVVAGGTYDLTNPYYGPAEKGVDLWASYERKLTKKINWKIQLNVRNAFADNGLIPISIEPDGKTWASVRMKPIQEWFLTNTFSF